MNSENVRLVKYAVLYDLRIAMLDDCNLSVQFIEYLNHLVCRKFGPLSAPVITASPTANELIIADLSSMIPDALATALISSSETRREENFLIW